jgi:hypothetical protein
MSWYEKTRALFRIPTWGGNLKKKVISAFVIMVTVVLFLAFANHFVEDTPEPQETDESTPSAKSESPIPSNGNSSVTSAEKTSPSNNESKYVENVENSSLY